MTYLEKVMQIRPDLSKEEILENYCPHHFNIRSEYYEECGYSIGIDICECCWTREMSEKTVVAHRGPFDDIEDSITPEKIEELKKEEQRIIEKFNEIPEEYLVTKEALEKILVGHPDPVGEPGEPGIPHIIDSGNRRQFETGAVRDIQEGKGRCDLMPLDVVGDITGDQMFHSINNFIESGKTAFLEDCIMMFRGHYEPNDGVVRKMQDLMPICMSTMFLEVSKHFEEGAKKYGENNWQKGIPVHCYIDSAVRHYLKFLRGDKDEPHNRAFCWNLMCAIWTCKHKPELNDYANTEV